MALIFFCGFAMPAMAQTAAERDELYQGAKADLQAGRVAFALEKLKRGLRRGVDDRELRWTYLLALAVAYDELKQPLATLEAVQSFEHALSAEKAGLPPVWEERLTGMKARAKAVEAEVLKTYGAIDVASTPGNALVLVDGARQGEEGTIRTPYRVYLPSGRRTVRFELEGYTPLDMPMFITEGKVEELHPKLTKKAQPSSVLVTKKPATRPKAMSVQPAPRLKNTARSPLLDPLWGWITAGSGAAVLLAGIPFTVMAYADRDELTGFASKDPADEQVQKDHGEVKDSMQQNEAIAGVLYGVGSAAVVGGVAWLVISYWDADSDRTAVGLVPTPGGGVVTFGGRW